jgi:protein-disulfide isomerase
VLVPGQQASAEQTTRLASFIALAFFAVALYEGLALRSRPAATESVTLPVPSDSAPGKPALPDATVADAIDNIIKRYADQDVAEIPVGPSDPRWGSPTAPAQLVVFSDFECPSCKANAKTLERIKQMFGPEKLSIVEKNYPLNSDCNSGIKAKPHLYACNAAFASVAAQNQGKFWEFYSYVYGLKGSPTPEVLMKIASKIGLDIGRFTTDMGADETKKKIVDDTELGVKLKLIQTPTIFLNGRLLTAETTPQMPILINAVLQKTVPAESPGTEAQL